MKIKINFSKLITYLFFLLYFFSYCGNKSNLKLPIIIVFQIYLMLKLNKKNITIHKSKLTVIIICIILSLFISLIVNFNASGFIKTMSLIDLFVFTYFMFPKMAKNQDSDDDLIKTISNTLFLVLLFSLVFFYNDIQLTSGRSSDISARHLFNFGEPSIVGFLCFIEFALAFYLIRIEKNNKKNIIINCVKIAVSVYMIYLADIRAATITIILFILIYMFEYFPKTKFAFFIKFLIVLFFTVFSMLYLYNETINIDDMNYVLSGRLTFFERGVNQLVKNNSIIFGEGSYKNSDVLTLNKIQLDNSYIDIWYQYGVISMSLFLILTIAITVKLFKIKNNKNESKIYDIFVRSYFISVIIYSMCEKNLFSLTSALSLVTFCLIFRYIEINEQNNITNKLI